MPSTISSCCTEHHILDREIGFAPRVWVCHVQCFWAKIYSVMSSGSMWFRTIFSAFCNMLVGNFGHGFPNEITSNRTFCCCLHVTRFPPSPYSLAVKRRPLFRQDKRLESVLFTARILRVADRMFQSFLIRFPMREREPPSRQDA